MAHNYTPSPVYHSPVVVADDGDAASAANLMSPVEQALDNAAAAVAGGVVRTLRRVADLTALAALTATDDEIALVSGNAGAPTFAPVVKGIYVFGTPGVAPTPDGVNVVASTAVAGSYWYALEHSRINVADGFARLDASKRLFVGPTAVPPYSAVSTFRSEDQTSTHPAGGLVQLMGTTTVGQTPALGTFAGSFVWQVRQQYQTAIGTDADTTWYAEQADEVFGPTSANITANRTYTLSNDYSPAPVGGAPTVGMRVRFTARHNNHDLNVVAGASTVTLRTNSGVGHHASAEFSWDGSAWRLSGGVLAL